MNSHEQWGQLLRAISQPGAHPTLDVVLRQAVELGSDVAPDAVGCSITEIADGDRYRTPVYSDQLALDLDRAQYESGDGPCMAAARERQRHYFDAALHGQRFPGFAEAAVERGVRSSISLPLTPADRSAALNLYATSRYAFDAERPRAVADLLARCVSALLMDTTGRPVEEPAQQDRLQAAQARARLIAEAEAALMASRSLSRSDALTLLIRRSRAQSRSIFEVAREVVQTGEAGVAAMTPTESGMSLQDGMRLSGMSYRSCGCGTSRSAALSASWSSRPTC